MTSLPSLDLRPLQEGHAGRGIGNYVEALAGCLPFESVVLWEELAPPPAAARRAAQVVPGAPNGHKRVGWAIDAAASVRARPGLVGPVHIPVGEVRMPPRRQDIVTIYDAVPWRFPEDYPAGRLGRVRRAMDARVARRAGTVITISQASADDLHRFFGVQEERLRIVHLALSEAWPRPGERRHRSEGERNGLRYVVAAGGFRDLDPRKRLGDLLEALTHLPDVALVVTGQSGAHEASFTSHAEQLGVRDRVHLTGQLSVAQLVDVFAGAAAFAFPSAWEGFGFPLLEAMTLGLPCVVSDGGALPEVAGDAALVVPVGRSDLLAEALGELLNDGARAAAASARSLVRARDFGPAQFAAGHAKAYESHVA